MEIVKNNRGSIIAIIMNHTEAVEVLTGKDRYVRFIGSNDYAEALFCKSGPNVIWLGQGFSSDSDTGEKIFKVHTMLGTDQDGIERFKRNRELADKISCMEHSGYYEYQDYSRLAEGLRLSPLNDWTEQLENTISQFRMKTKFINIGDYSRVDVFHMISKDLGISVQPEMIIKTGILDEYSLENIGSDVIPNDADLRLQKIIWSMIECGVSMVEVPEKEISRLTQWSNRHLNYYIENKDKYKEILNNVYYNKNTRNYGSN